MKRPNPYQRLRDEVAAFVSKLTFRRRVAMFTVKLSDHAVGKLQAARELGYSLGCTLDSNGVLHVHAVERVRLADAPYAVRGDDWGYAWETEL